MLRRVARETLQATDAIWADSATSLAEKFIRMRDWTFQSYLRFNPTGKGGRPWGLLSRFSMEADALTSDMRLTIRTTLRKLEDEIHGAVKMAVAGGELVQDTPLEGVTLQVSSVMYQTGQLTRHASSFSRLDELLKWTISGLLRAYGVPGHTGLQWPPFRDLAPSPQETP